MNLAHFPFPQVNASLNGISAILLLAGLFFIKRVQVRAHATCMIAALTFLPALLKLLTPQNAPTKKQPSGDNARSTLGREEPR